MSDLKKTVQGDKGVTRSDDVGPDEGERGTRTAGTNRDFDESGESKNQGHGTPREQRDRAEDAGRSNRSLSETDRRERDLGGPGG